MKKTILILTILSIFIAISIYAYSSLYYKKESVKVGILHSLSGTMSFSEKSVVDATLAAIKSINQNGGILGREITPVVADGASDAKIFAKEAKRLIEDEGVVAIFGAWTSASRKEIVPIIESFDSLLFYPVQYEGLEDSRSVVYLAQVPNQQIKPALKFALDKFGDNFFLVGSDYIFPRSANLYIKELSLVLNANIVGEEYRVLGGRDFKEIIDKIEKSSPDVIFNTLNGDSNIYFFRELYERFKDKAPRVISFSIAESEVEAIAAANKKESIVGHYSSWNYFSTIDSKENLNFKEILKNYGVESVPNDPMAKAFSAVFIYKQAVEACDSFLPSEVKRCLYSMSYSSPSGIMVLERDVMNSWQSSKIGVVNSDLEFDIIWSSSFPIRADSFPYHKTKEQWLLELENMYRGWDNSWSAKE